MMQHIKFLFSRLAGIASIEADRPARIHAIFADAECRFGEFESPAYIRRTAKGAHPSNDGGTGPGEEINFLYS